MTDMSKARAVPARRLSRATRLGTMAAGVAGNMALGSVAELSRGRRPNWHSLLLTPGNVRRVTDELARMRGAAMKLGQLVSMDTGDMLPPELAQIMARLRGQADFMPPAQLKQVLTTAWGPDWLRSFARFNPRPIAAASIGQVHRATLKDGREVAIKVQYPGVAQSIDSDVANVGALMKMSGLLPKGFDLDPYLGEARAQLHEETDYLAEARHLRQFGNLLAQDPRFLLPKVVEDWTTGTVLTMGFVDGIPIEAAPDGDRIAAALIDLLLSELFTFGVMQTDPNFANFRYDPTSGRIILLDFGATRTLSQDLQGQYRALMRAGLEGDSDGITRTITEIGFFDDTVRPDHRATILSMIERVFETVRMPGRYDFADPSLSAELQKEGMALAQDGFVPPPLPIDVLFLQRKFGGVFLLAATLKAKVDLREALERYL